MSYKSAWNPDFYSAKFPTRKAFAESLGINVFAINKAISSREINSVLLRKLEGVFGVAPIFEKKNISIPSYLLKKPKPPRKKNTTKIKNLKRPVYDLIVQNIAKVSSQKELSDLIGYTPQGTFKLLKAKYGVTMIDDVRKKLGIKKLEELTDEDDIELFNKLKPAIIKCDTQLELVKAIDSTFYLTIKMLKKLFNCTDLRVIKLYLGMPIRPSIQKIKAVDYNYSLMEKHLDDSDSLVFISKETGIPIVAVQLKLYKDYGTRNLSKIKLMRSGILERNI